MTRLDIQWKRISNLGSASKAFGPPAHAGGTDLTKRMDQIPCSRKRNSSLKAAMSGRRPENSRAPRSSVGKPPDASCNPYAALEKIAAVSGFNRYATP